MKKFRSGFEKKVAASIISKGKTYKYEEEKLEYTVPAITKRYIPDFKVGEMFIEAKGKFDRTSRAKMLLVIAQHPDLDIRMLFMRDNKISKNSKTKYSDWCEKNGVTYAVSEEGNVPDNWLD